MIICNALTRRYDDITAISDLTLTIEDQEVFGLLGPNGAGKTTTMRMLACLISPTAGDATIGGHSILDRQGQQEIRRITGLLPEAPGLYDTLSAHANLDFYGKLYGMPSSLRERSIKEVLEKFDLWDRRDDAVGTFSKGMRQKVAIARAILHDPTYLFLDEPTAGLDPKASKTVRDYIVSLREEGKTIVINTHNLGEAERICDRVALINGRMIQVGPPENLAKGLFARTLTVTLTEEDPSLAERLGTLPFVASVEASGARLKLAVTDPERTNPQLVRWLVEQGAQVQFIEEEEYSLEDVYLALIEESGRR
ncbi:MAG TPA: ABC transporter ATP-binding protein [Methanomicrobia archaeon]|nr:ABC transporter ATP-binding protein [Methanomicrobia archaeon]